MTHHTHAVGERPSGPRSTTTCGSSTPPRTGPRPTTSPPSSPDKLHELQRLFLLEAGKYNVFPLDDRVYERFNADIAGRPQLIRGNSQLLFGGMGRLTENSILVIKNKSHAVTAQLDVPEAGAGGVIIAQGGSFGGWSLYAKDGRPTYCYNLLGLQRFKIEGDRAIPPGEHQVRMEFAYDGGGLGKGGTATLYIDGDRGRRGPRRRHPGDDLLRRRDHRPRQPTPPRRSATTTRPATAGSPAASAGSRSTSTRPPRTTTTSSAPRNDSGSRWRASPGRPMRRPVRSLRVAKSVEPGLPTRWRPPRTSS